MRGPMLVRSIVAAIVASTALVGSFAHSEEIPPPRSKAFVSSEANKDYVLRHYRNELASHNRGGRINYVGECSHAASELVAFPAVRHRAAKRHQKVWIARDPSGVGTLRIGNVPRELLETRIDTLELRPEAQYNPQLAIDALQSHSQVKARAAALGLRPVIKITVLGIVQPGEGRPHLPESMTGKTFDQLLDLVADSFEGVVIFGICPRSGRYDIDFRSARSMRAFR